MFINITLDLTAKILVILLPLFLILYFVIFSKYNKRNKLGIIEIIFNLLEFLMGSMIHLLIFIIGMDFYIEGLLLIDAVYERYANFIVSVLIISGVIYHYIKYIKRLLIDIDEEEIKKNDKRIEKIGEYALFLFLCIMIITPILNLPRIMSLLANKKAMIKEIIESFIASGIGVFLIYHINPLNVIDKSRYVNKEEVEDKINIERIEEIKETTKNTKKVIKSENDKKNNNKEKIKDNKKSSKKKKTNNKKKSKKSKKLKSNKKKKNSNKK